MRGYYRFYGCQYILKACQERSQTFQMEFFVKIVNG